MGRAAFWWLHPGSRCTSLTGRFGLCTLCPKEVRGTLGAHACHQLLEIEAPNSLCPWLHFHAGPRSPCSEQRLRQPVLYPGVFAGRSAFRTALEPGSSQRESTGAWCLEQCFKVLYSSLIPQGEVAENCTYLTRRGKRNLSESSDLTQRRSSGGCKGHVSRGGRAGRGGGPGQDVSTFLLFSSSSSCWYSYFLLLCAFLPVSLWFPTPCPSKVTGILSSWKTILWY